jgi:hypothetical protein
MDLYRKKYIKYKKKYINLINSQNKIYSQSGGKFRTDIVICEQITILMNRLQEIILIKEQNNSIFIDELNKLYEQNIILFDDQFGKLALANINYLLDVKLDQISNEFIKDSIDSIYKLKQYNENPIPFKLNSNNFLHNDCLRDISVWNKQYLMEDFWYCSIDEFMDEIDKFDNSENSQSYLLFWTNVINISSLLCRIKTCNYYFIKFESTSEIPTADTYNNMLQNGEIVKMDELNYENHSYLAIKRNYPNTKLIFTYIKNINDNLIFNLTMLLIKSFDCKYNNLFEFYSYFLCLMEEKEIHNLTYNSDRNMHVNLIAPIKNICTNSDNNLISKNALIYLSLNLPNDSKFARNEYTNIVCSSINSLNLIDTIPLSMCQIVGHDYYFHGSIGKKKSCTHINKQEFRKYIEILKYIDINKNISIFNNSLQNVKNYMINDEFNKFKNNFLNSYIKEFSEYNMINMLDLVHYFYHEYNKSSGNTSSMQCFTIDNFIQAINKKFKNISSTTEKKVDIDYLLKIIAFIIYCNGLSLMRLINNYKEIISNIMKFIIIYKFYEDKDLITIENGFVFGYVDQISKINECLISNNNFIVSYNFSNLVH